jgi:superfamily II DNA helicase RecQ
VLLLTPAAEFELLIKERPEKTGKARKRAAAKKPSAPRRQADLPMLEALKKWRLGVAKKEGVPAFRVMTDKALQEIAQDRPASEAELLQVSGVGPRLASRYGAGILRVLQES